MFVSLVSCFLSFCFSSFSMYFMCVNNLSSAFCHGFLICELLFITIVSDHDFLISNVTQCGSCLSFLDIFLKNCHVNLA